MPLYMVRAVLVLTLRQSQLSIEGISLHGDTGHLI